MLDTLRASIARTTSSIVTPSSRALTGSTRMRTSASCRPIGSTLDISSSRSSFRSSERAASNTPSEGPERATSTTGNFFAVKRRIVGSVSISRGKSRIASSSVRISCSISSMSRLSTSSRSSTTVSEAWSVTTVSNLFTPSTFSTASSMGMVIFVSTSWAEAPGRMAWTMSWFIVTSGNVSRGVFMMVRYPNTKTMIVMVCTTR